LKLWRLPKIEHSRKMECPHLWPTYKGEKRREDLGQTKHMGLKGGSIGNTLGTGREHKIS
jgi:hypothetical protein